MSGDARSGVVRLLKTALPLTALGLVAAVFLSPRPEPVEGFGFDRIGYDAAQGLRLENPRFTGRAPGGEPFVVSADWALPDGPDPEVVALGPLRGQIALQGGRAVTLAASGGEMRPKRDQLRLDAPVRLSVSDGYVLEVGRAEFDIDAQTLRAQGPVAGQGPAGRIEAGSMRAARRGETHYIWFEDRVRVTIDPSRVE